MKILLYLIIYQFVCNLKAGQVFNWDNEITYNAEGNVNSIKMHFSLENGLYMNRYIYLQFPFSIGTVSSNDMPTAIVYEFELPEIQTPSSMIINSATNEFTGLSYNSSGLESC